MKVFGIGREKTLTIFVFIFLFGSETETGKLGRKNEIGYSGYQKRYNSIGSTSITVGNRYLKAGIPMNLITSNVQLNVTRYNHV